MEYFIKIITGALPVDAHDEYVKKYYEKGGKKIEDAVNAEYKYYRRYISYGKSHTKN